MSVSRPTVWSAEERSTGLKLPAVFNIAAHDPFLDQLVAGILTRIGSTPAALAKVTMLLPTRRSCRSLRDAFLRTSKGRPLLLPRMMAVGDVDADEILLTAPEGLGGDLDVLPAIAETRRQLLLTKLIRHWGKVSGIQPVLPAQAAALARDLARLLNQAQAEELGFAGLKTIFPEDHARHWQITHSFLDLLPSLWPPLLEIEGALDPSDRLNRLVRGQIAAWRSRPPTDPVIAAGFAATGPATADLLTLISLLPQGAVVLPGVEQSADEILWAAIGDDPTHPQHGIHQLLARMGVAHDGLPDWDEDKTPTRHGRIGLAREVMRPASLTENWNALSRGTIPLLQPPPSRGGGSPFAPPPLEEGGREEGAEDLRQGLKGLSRIDCADPQEEAIVVALLLRQRLERPEATAMLVTPDRGLARRVAAELGRWGIDIDDSGGTPLNQTPPGVFLRLLLDAAAENLAPVPLLALLKHPLSACGQAPGHFRALVRRLEKTVLRGPRPAAGLDGLTRAAAATKQGETLAPFINGLRLAIEPFLLLMGRNEVPLDELIAAHLTAAEFLAQTDESFGGDRLWSLDAGDAAATLAAELIDSSRNFGDITGSDYPALFETLLAGRMVRPRFGKHPRIQILGALEARLQQADLMILSGLNEGVWPTATGHDPWMSRPMRRDFGLRTLEASIGLAAHDFVSAFAAPEVVLTRAVKAEGAPTVPSRWLLRLDTVLRAVGAALPSAGPLRRWASSLSHPEGKARPCAAPAPKPPLHLRPRSLYVTEIEAWRRDPYAIFARHILKLRALDPIDADPGLAERGQIIHAALDQFVLRFPSRLPENALDELLACGRQAFAAALERPGVWAFWWPRFERIAEWIIAQEEHRRPGIIESLTEQHGALQLTGTNGVFTLKARADRIDRLVGGGLAIIDYKTGTLPANKDVDFGYAPQLPLEAAIAEKGGFDPLAAGAVEQLAFWKLSGGDPAGEICPIGSKNPDYAGLAATAIDGLMALIRAFDDSDTAYLARPRPDRAPRYSDYTHLTRVQEWGGALLE